MTTITALPTPPARTMTPDAYVAAGDAFLAALVNFVTQTNQVASEVNTNAGNAAGSATTATQQAAASLASQIAAAASASAAALSTGVGKWVSGTTYNQGNCVWSPIDFQNYRCTAASLTSSTDPSVDSANWRLINYLKPWTVLTGAYTAQNGDRLFANTAGGAFTITAPANPIAGVTFFEVADYAGVFGTNNLTINPNGANVEGKSGDTLILDMNNLSVIVRYVDATKGWVAR